MSAIRTHVEGFDKALGGGVPEGNVVLIIGGPGTMKSTFAYSVLHRNAVNGVPGLFVSLEQPAPDVVEKMAQLGMPPLPEDKLYVMDMSQLRLAFRDKEKGKDWIGILSKLFEQAVEAGHYRLFALASPAVQIAIRAFKEDRRQHFPLVAVRTGIG